MSEDKARGLMRSAWTKRRESFDASTGERQSALAEARAELTAAVGLLREDGSRVSYAQAVHLLANVELDLGREDRAMALWNEAIDVLRGTDDILQLAHKVRHLGDLHFRTGRLDEAEAQYEEALAIYREHDGPGSLDFANAVARVAALQEKLGDKGRALSLWRETRDLYAAVDLPAGVEDAEAHIRRLAGTGGS